MSDTIKRRDFLKGAVTGAGIGVLGAMGLYSYSDSRKALFSHKERKMADIGTSRKVKVTNISETSWFDNQTLVGDIKGAGGLLVDQYSYNWPPFGNGKGLGKGSYKEGIALIKDYLPHDIDKAWEISVEKSVNPENAGGYAALLEVEELSGKTRKFLLDSGWSYKWMDECFKREGIDKMLANREIEGLFISHEHFDHYWGLPVTLKYDPTITIYVPEGFYPEGKQYVKDAGHKGKLVEVKPGLCKHIPGHGQLCLPHSYYLQGIRGAVPVFQHQGQGSGIRDRMLPPGHYSVCRDCLQ
jgi:7,8-dihydropterin-6-yl-methyl-4-(beta-D-ribofuranosyl)aminobenzene 5'-phosphate synthase